MTQMLTFSHAAKPHFTASRHVVAWPPLGPKGHLTRRSRTSRERSEHND